MVEANSKKALQHASRFLGFSCACCSYLTLDTTCWAEDPVGFAARQLGKAYAMNPSAVGPDAYDCSGLTKASYAQIGIDLPHHAASQAVLGGPVVGPFQRGDLLFFDSSGQPGLVAHVAILESPGTMIHAATSSGFVRRDAYTDNYWGNHFLFAGRFIQPEAAAPVSDLQPLDTIPPGLALPTLRSNARPVVSPSVAHPRVIYQAKPKHSRAKAARTTVRGRRLHSNHRVSLKRSRAGNSRRVSLHARGMDAGMLSGPRDPNTPIRTPYGATVLIIGRSLLTGLSLSTSLIDLQEGWRDVEPLRETPHMVPYDLGFVLERPHAVHYRRFADAVFRRPPHLV